ncbi:MAG: hypothetical protein M1828_001987 [Chrysothrix sp. TS-e1954]|nr:MAG: hypothetical protein M1828_001987 [Chrysothrix sp. TS-e1954]
MAVHLEIPKCLDRPPHRFHFPPPSQPLRIRIEGPLTAVQRLVPNVPWYLDLVRKPFPQPAGPPLAKMTFRQVYGRDVDPSIVGDMVLRDEYLGWVQEQRYGPLNGIDYYGVTFDHLVPPDDTNPEVLMINIIEMDYDDGQYADDVLRFTVNHSEYIGKKVIAVPRWCGVRRGTQDRSMINFCVADNQKLRDQGPIMMSDEEKFELGYE